MFYLSLSLGLSSLSLSLPHSLVGTYESLIIHWNLNEAVKGINTLLMQIGGHKR